MTALLVGVLLLVVNGTLALFSGRSARLTTAFGAGGAVVGCACGLVGAFEALHSGVGVTALSIPWPLPESLGLGSVCLGLDALSAFFAIPILGLALAAAVYGASYLQAYSREKSLGPVWFNFNVTVAAMVLLLLARNGLFFLMAWEVMTLASFFLVAFEHEKDSVRKAAWTYLIASHLGTSFLLALFVLLGQTGHSLDFDTFAPAAGQTGLFFVLALIGFGTKAGFLPMHVWLPEAHPAAPSHVSALMSGVLIKTGIYGILRILLILGPPPSWCAWVMVAVGLTSGVLGVLFALAQHDLKRLLAYHSVENIGIIALGLGVGLLGVSTQQPLLAVLGFGGGLLHVLNHAIFKGLLFLGAGAVLHGTGTRDIDHLGGLLKRMPWTAACFLVGAVAICGLPPLNGFVSEFLIYFAAFSGLASRAGTPAPLLLAATIAALALIGGLAAACFAKAFGVVFLGEPRSEHAAHAHEASWTMRLPMLGLAALCLLIGMNGPFVVSLLSPVLSQLTRLPLADVQLAVAPVGRPLILVSCAAGTLVVLVVLLVLLRRWLLAGRSVTRDQGTWDCGYARPTARMQYTASSFAQPLLAVFRTFLRTQRKLDAPEGYFPAKASLATETPDFFMETLFAPVFRFVLRVLLKLRRLQEGHVQVYVLYIALTLLVLLVWKLG